ncbi:MAG: hypothetical protein P3W96_008955 [Halomonas sp.]|nr:hypothetical protein [Halomonas sp.]MDM7482124.1 hypothetical protein [Halomonas sp.]
MSYVACVCFQASGHPVAIEARYIQRIDSTPTHHRHIAADALPLNQPSHPTRWLTLRDAEGPWQLGITGDSEMMRLPSAAIYPLPPLLAARSRHPALCGIALEGEQLTLLLNGARLSPPSEASSTHHP